MALWNSVLSYWVILYQESSSKCTVNVGLPQKFLFDIFCFEWEKKVKQDCVRNWKLYPQVEKYFLMFWISDCVHYFLIHKTGTLLQWINLKRFDFTVHF